MNKVIIGVVLIAFLSLGCFREEEVPASPKYYEPTVPTNVLKNTMIAFNNCDDDLLKDMSSGDFVFYFDSYDVGRVVGGYMIPESWSYDEFREATTNLFSRAYSVRLTIDVDHVGEPGPGKKSYSVTDLETSLLVMVDESSGFSGQGFCDYEFEVYEGKVGGEFWHLTKWTDKRFPSGDASPAKVSASVGVILAYYRY